MPILEAIYLRWICLYFHALIFAENKWNECYIISSALLFSKGHPSYIHRSEML